MHQNNASFIPYNHIPTINNEMFYRIIAEGPLVSLVTHLCQYPTKLHKFGMQASFVIFLPMHFRLSFEMWSFFYQRSFVIFLPNDALLSFFLSNNVIFSSKRCPFVIFFFLSRRCAIKRILADLALSWVEILSKQKQNYFVYKFLTNGSLSEHMIDGFLFLTMQDYCFLTWSATDDNETVIDDSAYCNCLNYDHHQYFTVIFFRIFNFFSFFHCNFLHTQYIYSDLLESQ